VSFPCAVGFPGYHEGDRGRVTRPSTVGGRPFRARSAGRTRRAGYGSSRGSPPRWGRT